MNDKYLKIYRFPKGTTFNQTVLENKFEAPDLFEKVVAEDELIEIEGEEMEGFEKVAEE
tara:strand:- start:589 stop:765 length:177 start_codon:yes stop_codon:yes gene_type:complete